MLKEDLPALQKGMLDTSGDNIEAVILLLEELIRPNGLVDGLLDSVDAMNLTDVFEYREIFNDLGALLQDDALTQADSDLWPSLATMLEGMAEAIEASTASTDGDWNAALQDMYDGYGFQYNGN